MHTTKKNFADNVNYYVSLILTNFFSKIYGNKVSIEELDIQQKPQGKNGLRICVAVVYRFGVGAAFCCAYGRKLVRRV